MCSLLKNMGACLQVGTNPEGRGHIIARPTSSPRAGVLNCTKTVNVDLTLMYEVKAMTHV